MSLRSLQVIVSVAHSFSSLSSIFLLSKSLENSSCTTDMSPLSFMWFTDIFSHSAACHSILLAVFHRAKVLNFVEVQFIDFFFLFMNHVFSVMAKVRRPRSQRFSCPPLKKKGFLILTFTFEYVIHLSWFWRRREVQVEVLFFFFFCLSIAPAPFVGRKAVLPPLNYSCTFVKNQSHDLLLCHLWAKNGFYILNGWEKAHKWWKSWNSDSVSRNKVLWEHHSAHSDFLSVAAFVATAVEQSSWDRPYSPQRLLSGSF